MEEEVESTNIVNEESPEEVVSSDPEGDSTNEIQNNDQESDTSDQGTDEPTQSTPPARASSDSTTASEVDEDKGGESSGSSDRDYAPADTPEDVSTSSASSSESIPSPMDAETSARQGTGHTTSHTTTHAGPDDEEFTDPPLPGGADSEAASSGSEAELSDWSTPDTSSSGTVSASEVPSEEENHGQNAGRPGSSSGKEAAERESGRKNQDLAEEVMRSEEPKGVKRSREDLQDAPEVGDEGKRQNMTGSLPPGTTDEEEALNTKRLLELRMLDMKRFWAYLPTEMLDKTMREGEEDSKDRLDYLLNVAIRREMVQLGANQLPLWTQNPAVSMGNVVRTCGISSLSPINNLEKKEFQWMHELERQLRLPLPTGIKCLSDLCDKQGVIKLENAPERMLELPRRIQNWECERSAQFILSRQDRGIDKLEYVKLHQLTLPEVFHRVLSRFLCPWTMSDAYGEVGNENKEEEEEKNKKKRELKKKMMAPRLKWEKSKVYLMKKDKALSPSEVKDWIETDRRLCERSIGDQLTVSFFKDLCEDPEDDQLCIWRVVNSLKHTFGIGRSKTGKDLFPSQLAFCGHSVGLLEHQLLDLGSMSSYVRESHGSGRRGQKAYDRLREEDNAETLNLIMLHVWTAAQHVMSNLDVFPGVNKDERDKSRDLLVSSIAEMCLKTQSSFWNEKSMGGKVLHARKCIFSTAENENMKKARTTFRNYQSTCGTLTNALAVWRTGNSFKLSDNIFMSDFTPVSMPQPPSCLSMSLQVPQTLMQMALRVMATGRFHEVNCPSDTEGSRCECRCRLCCPFACVEHNPNLLRERRACDKKVVSEKGEACVIDVDEMADAYFNKLKVYNMVRSHTADGNADITQECFTSLSKEKMKTLIPLNCVGGLTIPDPTLFEEVCAACEN